jgi:hypothetical protein
MYMVDTVEARHGDRGGELVANIPWQSGCGDTGKEAKNEKAGR